MKLSFVFIPFMLILSSAFATEKNEPPAKGNFALEASQQPGSFISIGQNILEKNQVQVKFMIDYYVGYQ